MVTTPDPINDLELQLLRNDPKKLVVRYQNIMRIVAKIFIRNGTFAPSEMDDLVQFLNLHLLERIDRIQEQYDGSCLLRTYMTAVFRHALMNLAAKSQITPVLASLEGYPDTASLSPDANLHIEYDLRLLEGILVMYHRERPRTVLLLKLHYDIPITDTDIEEWAPNLAPEDRERFVRITKENEGKRTRSRVFDEIQPFFDKAEGVERRPDVLRTGVYARIDEIVRLLNGSPPTSTYEGKSLGILFEKFCAYNSRI